MLQELGPSGPPTTLSQGAALYAVYRLVFDGTEFFATMTADASVGTLTRIPATGGPPPVTAGFGSGVAVDDECLYVADVAAGVYSVAKTAWTLAPAPRETSHVHRDSQVRSPPTRRVDSTLTKIEPSAAYPSPRSPHPCRFRRRLHLGDPGSAPGDSALSTSPTVRPSADARVSAMRRTAVTAATESRAGSSSFSARAAT